MRFFVVFIAAISFSLGVALPALASPVNLPAGTKINVRLINSLSSGNATSGERFAFVAAAPVIVGNRVVVKKGADGTGRVASVSKAHGKSPGTMMLELTSIHAVDGTLVPLTANASGMHGNAEKGKASTATLAATIALGPLGLFAHNMVKGKDVTVTPNQALPSWVRSTTSVNVP